MNTKPIVFTAVSNLHAAIVSTIDLGKLSPNHPNGTKLRANLFPDGRAEVELASKPAKLGVLSFEFTIQRDYDEEDYSDSVINLTEDGRKIQREHGLVVDKWISRLLAKN